MAKETSKQSPSKSGVECEIDPEGFYVFANFRDVKTNVKASLKLHRKAANALRALLSSSEADDDDTFAVILRGELTIEGNPNEQSPVISGN